MRFLLPAAIAIALTAAAAISLARSTDVSAGSLAVTAAWARATPPGAKVGAAYLTIANAGPSDDRLVSAASASATSVTLHESTEENGVATMRPVEAYRIPVGGALEMKPGGPHLMLVGLAAPLKEGEALSLTLRFERAGELKLEVPIGPIGASAPTSQAHDHAM